MLVVALTGGIGSGKSLAAQYFSELGAQVIDADQLARTAIERGTKGFDEVIATFGDGVLKDGDIDRRSLGELVFKDPALLTRLEAIIHPKVRELFDGAISQLHGNDVLIYEIPLLVETGVSPRFDYILTIQSGMQMRKARLTERGLRASEIDSRILAQASDQQRAEVADYILHNDASPEELLREVEHLWEDIFPALQRLES